MNRGYVRLMMGAMAAAFAMTATAAMAQDVAFEEKKQAVIKNAKEPEKVQRTTLEQEEGAGPKVDFETDEMAAAAMAKGMGNTETMFGCGYNVYYAFLVKCQRFVDRFQKPMLTPMLVKERT